MLQRARRHRLRTRGCMGSIIGLASSLHTSLRLWFCETTRGLVRRLVRLLVREKRNHSNRETNEYVHLPQQLYLQLRNGSDLNVKAILLVVMVNIRSFLLDPLS